MKENKRKEIQRIQASRAPFHLPPSRAPFHLPPARPSTEPEMEALIADILRGALTSLNPPPPPFPRLPSSLQSPIFLFAYIISINCNDTRQGAIFLSPFPSPTSLYFFFSFSLVDRFKFLDPFRFMLFFSRVWLLVIILYYSVYF